jgi:hypothetical protein
VPPREAASRWVQILDRGDVEAQPQHGLDRIAAAGDVAEGGHDRVGGLGHRAELQPGGGQDAEGSFLAGEERLQTVAGDLFADGAADMDQLSRRNHRFEPGHPVSGYPVLEGMRATRVGSDVLCVAAVAALTFATAAFA